MTDDTMIALIIVSLITSYFLCAAIYPRLRPRSGKRWGTTWSLTPNGPERSSYTITGSQFSGMTCLGIAVFFGSVAWDWFFQEKAWEGLFIGFWLAVFGLGYMGPNRTKKGPVWRKTDGKWTLKKSPHQRTGRKK